MDKEQIKERIDFENISELITTNFIGDEVKMDYLTDFEGNYIIALSPLNVKFIEEIKLLKERLKKLEEVK